jgi:Barstar (barnase inhibitor)
VSHRETRRIVWIERPRALEGRPARLHELVVERSRAYELAWGLARDGMTTRVVRGRKMRSVDRLFDEVAAAFQFPNYFGENWPAFAECLGDLDWLPGSAYALVIVDAAPVLEEDPLDLPAFVRILGNVAAGWAEEVARGEEWDRPPIPFHVLLQEYGDGVAAWRERLRAVDVELAPLVVES